jgi:hypothetical protein
MIAQSKADSPVSRAPIRLLDSEPGHFAQFSWQNFTMVVWSSQATGPVVERLARSSEVEIRGFRHGFSSIHIVKNAAGLPTAEARAAFVALMQKYAPQLACVATIILGSGFWVSALQSVTTGMRMLAPRSFDHRINGSIEAACAWLPNEHGKRTGIIVDPAELSAAMHEAYERAVGKGA